MIYSSDTLASDARDTQISMTRNLYNALHFRYPGARTTKRIGYERSAWLRAFAVFLFSAYERSTPWLMCFWYADVCSSRREAFRNVTNAIPYHFLNRRSRDSLPPSFFSLIFRSFIFYPPTVAFVIMQIVIWRRKFACEKNADARFPGRRFPEWFFKNRRNRARGACAWRAFKICGYSRLVTPPVDRWPCTGDRRETGEEDLYGPQFFSG